jgi:cobalt-zinc-cadmium efflux system protein
MSAHAHAHDHGHGRAGRTRALTWTLALVVGYTAAEVVGGLLSGSLALLADAGHMVSDAAALALTLVAIRFARKAPTAERTFGHHRAEILAALANGAALLALSVFIFVEAYQRLREPHPIEGGLMLGVAAGGLLVNLSGLWLLHGNHGDDLNVRGAWLHVLTDALGSVQAMAAAVLIRAYGWTWVDPIASILIAVLVIYSSWALIRQSVDVLMEGTPRHIDLGELRLALERVGDVQDIHDLHVWTITSGFVSLSAHMVVSERADAGAVLKSSEQVLAERFKIRHSTLQIEHGPGCDQAHHHVH